MDKKKKKICFVCDVPNWAFDMIAKKLQKEQSHKYEIVIEYYDMRKNPDEFYELLEKNSDCDLMHFFWRKSLLQMETETFRTKVEQAGKNVEKYIQEKKKKSSTCVYDYMFTTDEEMKMYQNIFNCYTNHYYVCTEGLFEIYKNVSYINSPQMVIHDICDWDMFIPMHKERFNFECISQRPLVIGWVGNSMGTIHDVDLKGFHTLLKPVMNELKSEGFAIEEHYADRNEKWRSADEMPAYYSEIDVCVCVSMHEGTPRPVLEGMACGVPIIATDVGIVNVAFGERQKKFIIGSRENGKNDAIVKDKLREKIIELYYNRQELQELSNENIESIHRYDGGKLIQQFEQYFDICLENSQ